MAEMTFNKDELEEMLYIKEHLPEFEESIERERTSIFNTKLTDIEKEIINKTGKNLLLGILKTFKPHLKDIGLVKFARTLIRVAYFLFEEKTIETIILRIKKETMKTIESLAEELEEQTQK